ncbi:MAG: nucleotide exchange factor GrpE, partial [Verrucomicrobia bacterium]|nr:nucleotide exchange factor GrpE [Verrucomicrobiota bacterium]
VLDNFEMARTAAQAATVPSQAEAGPNQRIESLQAGVAMIQQQLKGILTEIGVEEINAAGQPFDPLWHEAISQQETAEAPEGQVIQQIRRGYKVRDRLLRPAVVIVAKKPAAPPA